MFLLGVKMQGTKPPPTPVIIPCNITSKCSEVCFGSLGKVLGLLRSGPRQTQVVVGGDAVSAHPRKDLDAGLIVTFSYKLKVLTHNSHDRRIYDI